MSCIGAGAQPVSGSAAELVWRREFEALTGGRGTEQATGGRRPHQQILHLRQVAYLVLHQGTLLSVCLSLSLSLSLSAPSITALRIHNVWIPYS